MRVLFVDAPPELLEERRRLGLDKRDELWEGLVHVVPPPDSRHHGFGADVIAAVHHRLWWRDLRIAYETAVYRPGELERSYRVPDLVVALGDYFTKHGIAGPPELVIEILSPHDESREKLPFYASLGCCEVLLIDRLGHRFELYRLVDGALEAVVPDEAGVVQVEAFDADLSVAGASLRLAWDGGGAEIAFA